MTQTIPTISVCMITCNEEHVIKKALDSLKEFADEIIVVDTGSTDKTKEIAKNAGAKLYDTTWKNDFSNARNVSLQFATKDWIFVPSIESAGGKVAATNTLIIHEKQESDQKLKEKNNRYLQIAQKKVATNPSAQSYYELGILHKELEQREKAKEAFDEAINQDNKHEQTLYELGLIEQKQGNLDKALSLLKKAHEIKPNDSEINLTLGLTYLKQDQLDEAEQHLLNALKRNPKKPSIYNNLGAVYEKKGDYAKAIQVLGKATELNAKNAVTYFNLGVVLEKINNIETAIKCYKQAIQLNHPKKDQIQKKIHSLHVALSQKVDYSFSVGEK